MATLCQVKRGMSGNGKIKKEEKVILLVQANNSTKNSTQIWVSKNGPHLLITFAQYCSQERNYVYLTNSTAEISMHSTLQVYHLEVTQNVRCNTCSLSGIGWLRFDCSWIMAISTAYCISTKCDEYPSQQPLNKNRRKWNINNISNNWL